MPAALSTRKVEMGRMRMREEVMMKVKSTEQRNVDTAMMMMMMTVTGQANVVVTATLTRPTMQTVDILAVTAKYLAVTKISFCCSLTEIHILCAVNALDWLTKYGSDDGICC